MLKDAAIALSLANLCFVKVWSKLLSSANSYFGEFPIVYASIVIDVLLLAVLFWGAITLARRSGRVWPMTLARWAFLLAVITVLNGVATLVITFSPYNLSALMGRTVVSIIGLTLTGLAVFSLIRWGRLVTHTGPKLILALLPFVFLTFSQSIWRLVSFTPVAIAAVAHQPNGALSEVLPSRKTPATRVLWLIFDEMDQRMTFSERPASVQLPELDRLRSQSLYATNAYPPAPLTYMSMPALISGRLVEKVTPVSSHELMLTFAGSTKPVGWSTQPSVFSEARNSGYSTALIGWCHPYCDVIGGGLTTCDVVKEKNTGDVSLQSSMFAQAQSMISTMPLVQPIALPLIQRVAFINQIVTHGERQKYLVRYQFVLNGALKAITNPDLDLIMVHSPAPHPPGIYDRATGTFSMAGDRGYLDNLALVDRTVGELRRAMELAGTWDQTTVVISADHWWRTEMWSRGPFLTKEDAELSGRKMDHRIPFVVKLAGQPEPITYDHPFNTVLTHDLLLALLRGEVSSPQTVAAWLDAHRTIGDSPYNRDELLP
ncbi:MAG: hypothetical protein QOE77_3882 [Blastocatellia bacterium]|jgi:hypothetical protein|nr:hypothetical protein [Blastocatellia bacterium]